MSHEPHRWLGNGYGCLAADDPGVPAAIARVRNWIFQEQRFGLIDVHQRDWDEPAGNGGFLFNGGRCYIDMGHLEYCTPECLSLLDVLRHDQAGDAILLQAVRGVGWRGKSVSSATTWTTIPALPSAAMRITSSAAPRR